MTSVQTVGKQIFLQPHIKVRYDRDGVESSVHAAISLWVAVSNAMHNGDKLLQIIKGRLLDWQRLLTT